MSSLIAITLLTCSVSLLAKWAADAFLHERVVVLGSFAGLSYTENAGIAFGIKLPGVVQSILILAALIVVALFARTSAQSRLGQIAFGLILGGALANIVDRLRDGLVTDFFQVGAFPIFNVADSCITVGAALLLMEALRKNRG